MKKYHLARAHQYDAQAVSYEFALEADLADPSMSAVERAGKETHYNELIRSYRNMAAEQRRLADGCEDVQS